MIIVEEVMGMGSRVQVKRLALNARGAPSFLQRSKVVVVVGIQGYWGVSKKNASGKVQSNKWRALAKGMDAGAGRKQRILLARTSLGSGT